MHTDKHSLHHFKGQFPGEPGLASSPSVIFLLLFEKRTFADMWQWFFTGWVPFLSRSQWLTVSEYWRECGALTSTTIHFQTTVGRATAAFMPTFQLQVPYKTYCYYFNSHFFQVNLGRSVPSLVIVHLLGREVWGLVERHFYRLHVLPAIQPAVSEVLTGIQSTNHYQALAWPRPFFHQNSSLI